MSSPSVWLPANQAFSVLKEDERVSFTGDGEEDGTLEKGSCNLKAISADSGSKAIGWHLVFQLDTDNYFLDVNGDDVTATKYTEDKPPEGSTYFVPVLGKRSFQALTLGSDENKCLAVTSTLDKRLIIKNWTGKEASPDFIEYRN